jgi:aryl-alcohol dehydrogenase-like predicted oxidoreductase
VEDSLRRLRTDWIDLLFMHVVAVASEEALRARDALEELTETGAVAWYGWSTDDPAQAALFAPGPHCAAVQARFNLFEQNEEMLALCEREDLALVCRSPLATGLLAGLFSGEADLPENDWRSTWDLHEGEQARRLAKMRELGEVLTGGERSLAQGALAWLWARSERLVPIPGFQAVDEVDENVAAWGRGPLSEPEMREIDRILALP